MKMVSWFGALVMFVAVGIGTTSMLSPHSRAFTARSFVAVATGATAVYPALPNPPRAGRPAPAAVTLAPAPVRAAAPARSAAPAPIRTVPPAIVIGSTQQAYINQDRARSGLRGLTWSSCLASIARSNAIRMAHQGYISHTDGPTRDLGCHLGYQAGENVGWWSGGVSDAQINSMFMNSADHRANILGPYHYVGTAWVTAANGYGYIAVELS